MNFKSGLQGNHGFSWINPEACNTWSARLKPNSYVCTGLLSLQTTIEVLLSKALSHIVLYGSAGYLKF